MASRYAPARSRANGRPSDLSNLQTGNGPVVYAYSPGTSRFPASPSVSRAMKNRDWRLKDERLHTAFDAPYTPSAHHQGLDPKRCSVMAREVCTVGMVVRAAVHEQDFHDAPRWATTAAKEDDIHSVASRYGQIYSKVRWMIVVALFENHYLTIPLYTHNGKGLKHKSPNAKLEYVSVRDARHRGDFTTLSHHRELEAGMDRGAIVLDRNTVAHLTAPVTRKYDLLVEHQGHLDSNSRRMLIKLWRECTMGM
ncbi:MAG: hypothetical protein Q9163_005610 [Psora crenata]